MIFLDTMALLYFLAGSQEFSNELRNEILGEPTVFVSVASFWEIGIKGKSGKLDLDGVPIATEEDVAELIETTRAQGFQVVPITEHHACSAPFLHGTHKDPFDRMIVAQALERNATLLSSDSALDKLSPSLRRKWAEPVRKPPSRV